MGIKLIIEESPEYSEAEIVLRCERVEGSLRNIVDYIRVRSDSIAVKADGISRLLPLSNVFYFESVDKKTFVCSASSVYECAQTLTELEKRLTNSTFVRVSKSCIVNTVLIKNVRPLDNHRLKVFLRNGEAQIINRHYVAALKAKLGL
jgi:DNA-binding LytR/AlgR family response regulator